MKAQSEEMSVAQEIVRFLLGKNFSEKVRVDGDLIAFDIEPRPGWKLRRVVFSRLSLGRLAADHDREVKLDYLRRDLLRCAPHRAEYRYPRVVTHPPLTVVRAVAR